MRATLAILTGACIAGACSLNPQPLPPDTYGDAGGGATTLPTTGADSGRHTSGSSLGTGGDEDAGEFDNVDSGTTGIPPTAGPDGGRENAQSDAGPDASPSQDGASDASVPDAASDVRVVHDADVTHEGGT